MKRFKFKIRGNLYDVEIINFEKNTAEIEVNGTHYSVELQQEFKEVKTPTIIRREAPVSKEESKISKKESKAYQITAPLPGNILQIFVKVGQEVKKDQKLIVMEAMKMENNVLAEKEGIISSIKVNVGDAVLQGDLILEIE
jgi:glutaconyl-CoA/methylmalonyl-CoA decarboxylase subunit gamma